MSIFSKYNFFSDKKAFTLVELVIVMSITTILATVVAIGQGTLSDRIALNSQAHDLSLIIRQAQIYALGVRQSPVGSSGNFGVGYGVKVDISSPTVYSLFVWNDLNSDGYYDSGESTTIETRNLVRGTGVNKVCGTLPGGNESCSVGGVNSIYVTFIRPKPTTLVALFNSAGSKIPAGSSPPARVELKSPKGVLRNVKINYTGQISVE